MIEHYKSLAVILLLGTFVFVFAKTPVTATAMKLEDFIRRRNCWYAVTLIGFLSPNFLVFSIVLSLFLIYAAKHEHNPAALFFFILLALPQIVIEIPGFAGISYLFNIYFGRILAIFILLPAFLNIRKSKQKSNADYAALDLILAFYIILNLAVELQFIPLTESFRHVLYWITDVILPYYVISRSIQNLVHFRDVIMSLVLAAMIAALIGAFEYAKSWILYASLGDVWGVQYGGYLFREGSLRAIASSEQPIVFGYVLAVAMGLLLFLKPSIRSPYVWTAGFACLAAGEVASISRGPWVGVAVMMFVYFASGPNPLLRIIKLGLLALPFFGGLMMTNYGEKILNYLPFIGTINEENVTYRQQLFETSRDIILNNPWFGSSDYLLHMENMRQGDGIIDLVNTFLIVALNTGLVGLALFSSFFVLILLRMLIAMRKMNIESEEHLLGQALIAALIGILVIIATVSPISHVPIFYWSVAAMGMAYFGLSMQQKKDNIKT